MNRLIPSFFVALVLLFGCSKPGPGQETASTKPAILAQGTEVPLILLRQIEAGSTREGALVPFMVGEDVRDAEGNVLIPKGTVA